MDPWDAPAVRSLGSARLWPMNRHFLEKPSVLEQTSPGYPNTCQIHKETRWKPETYQKDGRGRCLVQVWSFFIFLENVMLANRNCQHGSGWRTCYPSSWTSDDSGTVQMHTRKWNQTQSEWLPMLLRPHQEMHFEIATESESSKLLISNFPSRLLIAST